jgi:iron(III) transport system substrate-binding protein
MNSIKSPNVVTRVRLTLISALVSGVLIAALPAKAQTYPELQKLTDAAKAEGTVMVYHTAGDETIQPVFKRFQEKYNIKVEDFHAAGAPLTVRFSTESAAGQMAADVFYASDTTVFAKYPSLFQKLSSETFPGYNELPAQDKLESGLAIGHAQVSFAFMYNTKKVQAEDVPKTWNDLVDPKWKGQTLLVDPQSSTTYLAAFNMVRKYVPGIISEILANNPRLVESASPAAQQISAGAASIAFINYPSHVFPLMEKGAPIKWVTIGAPEITRNAWIGATKGPHPNAGRLLLHFLLSDEGLKIYCSRANGAKTITDPEGKRTGCNSLDKDALFLPDDPLSKTDRDEVVREFTSK